MYNILIVDDQHNVSDVLQEMLARFGHNAAIASGGYEGIQMFDTGHFDLVITDVLMPGVDGHDVARHVRNSRKPFTRIIGISGTPWFLENNDFDKVISKPFDLKTLLDAVYDVMSPAICSPRESYGKALPA